MDKNIRHFRETHKILILEISLINIRQRYVAYLISKSTYLDIGKNKVGLLSLYNLAGHLASSKLVPRFAMATFKMFILVKPHYFLWDFDREHLSTQLIV